MGWSNFGVAVISQQNLRDAENITRARFWNAFTLYSVSSKVFQAEHLFYYFTTMITVGQTTPAAYLSCHYVSTPHQVIHAYKHFFWSVGAVFATISCEEWVTFKARLKWLHQEFKFLAFLWWHHFLPQNK